MDTRNGKSRWGEGGGSGQGSVDLAPLAPPAVAVLGALDQPVPPPPVFHFFLLKNEEVRPPNEGGRLQAFHSC